MKKIILASTSPRRIDLLKQIGIKCEVWTPFADETPQSRELPGKLVARLALEKACSVVNTFSCSKLEKGPNILIISADTIVVEPRGKKILNKPTSVVEARKMLEMLAGKTHTVLTGYCIYEIGNNPARPRVRVVQSKVKMRKLSSKQIAEYVASGEPMDKAGAYAAQGRGMALIEKINGSYANVVGLPVCQLVMDLEKYFGYL